MYKYTYINVKKGKQYISLNHIGHMWGCSIYHWFIKPLSSLNAHPGMLVVKVGPCAFTATKKHKKASKRVCFWHQSWIWRCPKIGVPHFIIHSWLGFSLK